MLSILKNFFRLDVKSTINISDAAVKALARLGITNIRDLLFYRPSAYHVRVISPDLSKLQNGQLIQAEIVIQEISLPAKAHQPLKILASNDTGSILLVFFHKLPPFIFNRLRIGSKHTISGKVQMFDYYFQISHPDFLLDTKLHTGIEVVYPLTYGIVSKQIHSYILQAINKFEAKYKEIKHIIDKKTQTYVSALLIDLKLMHMYGDVAAPEQIDLFQQQIIKNMAKRELISNQMAWHNIYKQLHLTVGYSFTKAQDMQESILKTLNFTLTHDQQKVIEEIEHDQKSYTEMIRLLQGDVGSGKTLVALMTMVNVVHAGFQTVLMAPTDLLANQHHKFFITALNGTNIKVELLTGKIIGRARDNILTKLKTGAIDILIGTHTLFQEKVNFSKLGFIVIDEQHKFGVQQRLSLISKAERADVLIMTATPIPRSLTLTMFGDMNISKLIHKPTNRLPISTTIIPDTKIDQVIKSLEKKILLGERIYWICPLINQNDQKITYLMNVEHRFSCISAIYPNITGVLHGKMTNDQKDAVMQKFKTGDIQILVATTIIEVGIDVTEATLIIIENAEQFGLAQLHQIRGRVGRGPLLSHCILLYHTARLSNVARKRFEIMKSGNDGFYIAEQDLLLRGGGEILGTKQSGEGQFFFADLARDADLLISANKYAQSNAETDHEFVDFQIQLFAKTELRELN